MKTTQKKAAARKNAVTIADAVRLFAASNRQDFPDTVHEDAASRAEWVSLLEHAEAEVIPFVLVNALAMGNRSDHDMSVVVERMAEQAYPEHYKKSDAQITAMVQEDQSAAWTRSSILVDAAFALGFVLGSRLGGVR